MFETHAVYTISAIWMRIVWNTEFNWHFCKSLRRLSGQYFLMDICILKLFQEKYKKSSWCFQLFCPVFCLSWKYMEIEWRKLLIPNIGHFDPFRSEKWKNWRKQTALKIKFSIRIDLFRLSIGLSKPLAAW